MLTKKFKIDSTKYNDKFQTFWHPWLLRGPHGTQRAPEQGIAATLFIKSNGFGNQKINFGRNWEGNLHHIRVQQNYSNW